METYEFLKVLIKRYPNNYELGAAIRNIHHEITECVGDVGATVEEVVKYSVKEIIKKNFQPS